MAPKHKRSSSTPPMIVLSDSDSVKSESKPIISANNSRNQTTRASKPKSKRAKKWQSTLVDFASLPKPKPNAGPVASGSSKRLGKSKLMTQTSLTDLVKKPLPQSNSSPVNKPQSHYSPIKKFAASPTRKLLSSPDKPPSSPDSSEKDQLESTDVDEAEETKPLNIGLKRRASRVVESDEESDDDEAPVVSRIKRARAKVASSDESEEDVKKETRRIIKRPKSEEISDSQEETERKPVKEEAEDSDDDPMDGLDDNVVLDSRLRSAPQRNNRITTLRENLARLKRRKLGHATPPVVKSESESGSEEEDEDVDRPRGRRLVRPIPGARPIQPTLHDWVDKSVSNSEREVDRSTNNATTSDDDQGSLDSWIEQDEAAPVELPEGYSMRGHQSLEQQFKAVMELTIHLACLKAKKRRAFREDEQNDRHYGLSLRALRRKMDGLRDSAVTSSTWTSEFKEAFNTHPIFELVDLDFAVPRCDACRISSRLSTYRGNLSGDNYDRDTFEARKRLQSLCAGPIRDTTPDDSDSDSEPLTSFDLGRFCKARARCYHNFFHLFERTADEIKILKTARRRNDPNQTQRPASNDPAGIMAWLEARGIVQQEWTRLEHLMEAARGLEYRKGDEEDG